MGKTFIIVTVMLPVKVLVCAAVPAPAKDWLAPAATSAAVKLSVPLPPPSKLVPALTTGFWLNTNGGNVTPNVSVFDVVFVVDLLALKDSFKVTVKMSPILLALLSPAKKPD